MSIKYNFQIHFFYNSSFSFLMPRSRRQTRELDPPIEPRRHLTWSRHSCNISQPIPFYRERRYQRHHGRVCRPPDLFCCRKMAPTVLDRVPWGIYIYKLTPDFTVPVCRNTGWSWPSPWMEAPRTSSRLGSPGSGAISSTCSAASRVETAFCEGE